MGVNKPSQQYIRYDPQRIDFTITEAELEIIERGNAPLWKDVFLVAFPLAASTLFNAYGEGKSQQGEVLTFTLPIFINTIIGVVSVGFAILAGIAWYRSKTSFKAVVNRIKDKPLYAVPYGTFPSKNDEEQEADPQGVPQKKKRTKKNSKSGTHAEIDKQDETKKGENNPSDDQTVGEVK